MNFDTFDLHPDIMAGVKAVGYTRPTPIQHQAIPPILQGKDVIGLAQTGTGKTAAFVLPLLQLLRSGPRGQIRALIISPTRELAEQISEVINSLGAKTGLRSITVFGGVSMEQQIRALHRRPEILVACPGRLLDHLWRGSIKLDSIQTLVIDEADRMFDMGFLPDVRNILGCILHRRQTLLFSATMPDKIKDLAGEILHDPVTIAVDRQAPAKTISHALYPVEPHLKTGLLRQLLSTTATRSVLIFTRTKHKAERLAQQLCAEGYQAASLQGNLTQSKRQATLNGFRNGSIKILVATDIAARGIDVLSISHVINYDMPESPEDYIHRIGRTGRVDNAGSAFTFVTRADKLKVHLLERLLSQALTRIRVADFDYSTPVPVR